MPLEIEKKYFINKDKVDFNSLEYRDIFQGYIKIEKDYSIRVRSSISKDSSNYYLTTKERVHKDTMEHEIEIPENMFFNLFKNVEYRLSKRRWYYPLGRFKIEIDEFKDEPISDLFIAEIEVEDKSDFQTIVLPEFIEGEVHDEEPYKNVNLVKRIYMHNKEDGISVDIC